MSVIMAMLCVSISITIYREHGEVYMIVCPQSQDGDLRGGASMKL
jgi:hypothetical protein